MKFLIIPFEVRRRLPFQAIFRRPKFKGYCFASIEILYHRLDYPSLLQTYLWQKLDVSPELPGVIDFLEYWHQNIEAQIRATRVACTPIVSDREIRHARAEFKIN